jgi:formamidopyrimidine-DNA glycosylase
VPELPDVEIFRRFLERHAVGRVLSRVSIHDRRALRGMPESLFRRAAGKRVVSTRRHGKHLFAHLPGAGWLVFHFGMTGSLERFEGVAPREPALVAVLHFAEGGGIAFLDPRKFGRFGLVDDPDDYVSDRSLGVDALAMDRVHFDALVSARRGSLKALLMDQGAVAGIGNLYADEILFQAGLHPLTPAASLGPERRAGLFGVIRRVLRAGIDHGALSSRLPRHYLLRHRDDNGLCPRCGSPLRRIQAAGRTTVFCPRDQRGVRRRASSASKRGSPRRGSASGSTVRKGRIHPLRSS